MGISGCGACEFLVETYDLALFLEVFVHVFVFFYCCLLESINLESNQTFYGWIFLEGNV